jgi:hypothetical protein
MTSSKGKMRDAMLETKRAAKLADAMAKSAAMAAMPGFATGTLSRDQFSALRGEDTETYIRNFFKRFKHEFPAGYVRSCGYCTVRAMGYEDGYISEEEMRDAKESRLRFEARKAAKAGAGEGVARKRESPGRVAGSRRT